ncbi:hypothetical protein FB451DRAFT_1372041 [Mycena latifolia]|nr:hypothetical protein FB451DRAFT_1372041 [Mycena latifolia]
MALPLIQRCELDSDNSPHDFFVNATYGQDFAPTRDRSISANGAVWTFKLSGEQPSVESQFCRVKLMPYLAWIFGEVTTVRELLYNKQIAALRTTILQDSAAVGGAIHSSWLCADLDGDLDAGVIYVFCRENPFATIHDVRPDGFQWLKEVLRVGSTGICDDLLRFRPTGNWLLAHQKRCLHVVGFVVLDVPDNGSHMCPLGGGRGARGTLKLLYAVRNCQFYYHVCVIFVQNFCETIVPLITPHFHHINEFFVRCTSDGWLSLSYCLANVDTLTLRSFGVTFTRAPSGPPLNAPHPGPLSENKDLRELRLSSYLPLWGSTPNYTSLTTLRLLHYSDVLVPSWTDLVQILEAPFALEVLELDQIQCPTTGTRRVSLPCLRELLLCHTDNGPSLASLLDAPMLRVIRVQVANQGAVETIAKQCRTLLANAVEVGLIVETDWSGDVRTFFSCLRAVQVLDLRGNDGQVLLGLMDVTSNTDLRLPRLAELRTDCVLEICDAEFFMGSKKEPCFATDIVVFAGRAASEGFSELCHKYSIAGFAAQRATLVIPDGDEPRPCSELGNGCSSFPLPPILEGVLRVSGQDSVFTMMHHTQTTVSRMLDATDADNSRSRPLLRTTGKHPGSHCTQFRAFNRHADLSDAAQRTRRAATPRILQLVSSVGMVRDGAAVHSCRRKQQNMTHAAVAPRGRRLLALMPPVPAGGRLTRRPAVHRDVGAADFLLQAGTPLQVRQERTRQSGKDNKGAGLAYNQYKPLFDLLASPPLLALKYHQQVQRHDTDGLCIRVEVEENGLIDDGSASTTTAPAVSAVAHLSFASVQLAGVRDLDDVGIGVQRLKERDGLLGFGEGLGSGGNDEKDLFDLLDAVAAGEADEGFGGGKEEKKKCFKGGSNDRT